MVHIGDTTHSHKGKIVQDPADDWVESGVVDLVNFSGLEVVVAALPANQVEGDNKDENSKTGCATPVDCRVSKEEVFDNC